MNLSLPLAGIPFAVKDNIDVAGLPTTAACPSFAYHPERDAGVVARLTAAGAIVIGKTNLDQFATGLVGVRSPYGACANVYDEAYLSGGSSSGSAVAVARGLVPFALGTDTAGSGRIPASFNNLVGLKPTRGLLSTSGVVPACRTLDCVSVFTRDAADAELVLAVAKGADPEDPFSRTPPAGATAAPWAAGMRDIILGGCHRSAVDAYRAQYQLQALISEARVQWTGVDVLAVPTAGTIYTRAAVEADPVRLNTNLGYYTNFANLMDLAVLAVPAGLRADGLPFGISLVGPAFSDAGLLALGARFEGAADGPRAPGCVPVAVVGAHLTGQPLNRQLTDRGSRLLETTRTAPDYRLFALADTTPPKPGLVREPGFAGAGIEVEVWAVPEHTFGGFVDGVPPPLGIGNVRLADGRWVKGFICEGAGLAGAAEITGFGGWRAYRRSLQAS